MDDLCVFSGQLSGDQISALYQYSENRYRFDPAFCTLSSGASQPVTASLIDASLPLGSYTDAIILCQPGDPVQFGNFTASLIVSSVGPKAPEGLNITRQPDGNFLLSWQYVTQNTLDQPFYPSLYRVYGGGDAGAPLLSIIGNTEQNSLLVDGDTLPPGDGGYFFYVKAE